MKKKKLNKKKIIITGSTGFLGSKIFYKLKDQYDVYIISKSLKKNHIKKIFNYTNSDLKKISKIKSVYGFIHCATCYGRNLENKKTIYNSNYFYPLRILRSLKKNNSFFFFNFDTYLNSKRKYEKGINHYVKSKKLFLNRIKSEFKKIKVINIILFHMYGPNDNMNKFIPQAILKMSKGQKLIVGPGNQVMDLIYIDDVVSIFFKLVKTVSKLKYNLYNFELGTGKSTSLKMLLAKLKEKTKSKSEIIYKKKNNLRKNIKKTANTLKLKKIIGIYKFTSLDKGIKKTSRINQC